MAKATPPKLAVARALVNADPPCPPPTSGAARLLPVSRRRRSIPSRRHVVTDQGDHERMVRNDPNQGLFGDLAANLKK